MATLSPVTKTKAVLEALLRERRLTLDLPPLRGEGLRRARLSTGLLDSLLEGGFPRGQLSEVYGAASSGRTGLLMSLLARSTRSGALAAWVDPGDRFDPASAEEAGLDPERVLWLRGEPGTTPNLNKALAATATLLDSGLFEAIVLDLAAASFGELCRLPRTSFLRLARQAENGATALVLLAQAHTAKSAGGLSVSLDRGQPRFSGQPGPSRLLRGLRGQAAAGRPEPRSAGFELHAL